MCSRHPLQSVSDLRLYGSRRPLPCGSPGDGLGTLPMIARRCPSCDACGVAAALALTASSLALLSTRLPGRNGPSRSSAKHRCRLTLLRNRPSTFSSAPLRSSRLSPCPAHAGLLSWGWTKETGLHRHLCPSPLHRPSLAGRLSRGHRARLLPDGKQASHPSAPGCQSRSHVPSSWFCTTSTAFSARRLEGLLHPSADHGVRLVSCATARRPAHFPRRVPPLEELPRPAVGSPVTRCLGPLDVLPRSSRILTTSLFPASRLGAGSSRPSSSGLFPSNRSVTPSFVAERRRPVLPGLLIPLRGPRRARTRRATPSPGLLRRAAHRPSGRSKLQYADWRVASFEG